MSHTFRVVDLFAGVGGIRLGFERAAEELGHAVTCGYACDIDRFARQTYLSRYPDEVDTLQGDIRKTRQKMPKEFDVALAGFPCQPFSLAGVTKKNSLGRPHGLEDEDSGTLFDQIVQVLEERWPAAFLLENVRHLLGHRGGSTYATIENRLSRAADGTYVWRAKRINSSSVVPQARERVYFVGYRVDVLNEVIERGGHHQMDEVFAIPPRHLDVGESSFWFPKLQSGPRRQRLLREILHDHRSRPTKTYDIPEIERIEAGEYTLSNELWSYLRRYRDKHRGKGNGFGCSDLDPSKATHTRTLSARYHKDGSEILIRQSGGRNPRRLTPRECARLMGFRDHEIDVDQVSRTQAYRQMGNSVVVPVIEQIARPMVSSLALLDESERNPLEAGESDEAA